MEMYEGPIHSLSEEQFNDLLDYLRWDVNSGMELDVRPVLPIRSDFKDKLFRFANVAVEYYNQENRSNQFEILDPLHYTPAGTEQYHLGFIARSKEDSSLLKLFFAEVSSSDDKVMARKCIIVEPGNPLFVIGCDSCHPDGVIYHPFHYRDPLDDCPPLHFSSRQSCAKRLLSEAYIITSFEQNLNAEDVDELKVATCRYVYDALYAYNANHVLLSSL